MTARSYDHILNKKSETVTQRRSSSPDRINHFMMSDRLNESRNAINQYPHAHPVLQLQRIEPGNPARQHATQYRENKTGLPDNLKMGIENLSGYSMNDVKVHYHSHKPAQLQALAYAQGTHIHLASGQEKHLPHEAWHVVQQKQGRVKATMQMRGKVNVNDDTRLEKEADIMGARALQASSLNGESIKSFPVYNPPVVQRVRGGLEFTESQNPGLHSYPTPALPLAGPIGRAGIVNVQGTEISAFPVPAALMINRRNIDHTLAVNGQVSLTNDVISAEWIIARHGADVTPAVMRQNMAADIALMFRMREDLADGVAAIQGVHVGSTIALAPGRIASLDLAPDPQGVFVYYPGNSQGAAQITVQYTSAEAIKRINLLNASKYLQGTKVDIGEDITRISGAEGLGLTIADAFGTTSFSQAGVMLADLVRRSQGVQDASLPALPNPAVIFTAAQVGLIKLMVLNDAMAATMTRHNARLGQTEQKNIQRFFPKSRREEYAKAVARTNVNALTLIALRAEINRTAAADAQLYFDMADPGALRTLETTTALGAASPHTARIIATAGRMNADPPPAAADITHLKNHVLGVNGALLATWIGHGANAYTDTSAHAGAGSDAGHYHGGGAAVGNVIRSTARGGVAFTPVARANPGDVGAVYEFREREIAADDPNWNGTVNGSSALLVALDALFTASE